MNILQNPIKIEDMLDNEESIRLTCKKGYTTTAVCVSIGIVIKGAHVSCDLDYSD